MEKTDSSPLSRQALYADKKQWNQFLSVFLLAVGVGFTVAGIIFFFAYNWDELPKFAKLGIVEVLLIASVLLVTFTRWNKLVKQILLTGATFLIGTLFAVFGLDKENGLKYILISEKGCADPSTEYSLELTDGLLPLDTHTFDKDALILENEQVRKVTLYNKEKQAYLSLHFNAPVVGLWSPPAKNAPFVCIEPWYGRCDRAHYTGEYKDKDWMQHLQPEEIFQGGYTIEIDE